MSTPAYMKLLIPEFASVDDDTLRFWLEESASIIAEATWWGDDYNRALAYRAAHEYKTANAQVDDDTQFLSMAGITGQVSSLKTLDWSVGFTGILNGSESGFDAAIDGDLLTTVYGKKFIALRNSKETDLTYKYEP